MHCFFVLDVFVSLDFKKKIIIITIIIITIIISNSFGTVQRSRADLDIKIYGWREFQAS